jgi:hypothetical protein
VPEIPARAISDAARRKVDAAKSQSEGRNAGLSDSEIVGQECAAIEEELAKLRVMYEQYFLGIERKPPAQEHEALKRRVLKLRAMNIRATVVKFKVQSLAASVLTYERLWERTLREIEAGTYHRDIFKARLHAKKRAEEEKLKKAGAPGAYDVDEDVDMSDMEEEEPQFPPLPSLAAAAKAGPPTVKPGAPLPVGVAPKPVAAPLPRPSAPAPAPVAASGGLSDQKIKAIYDAYVMAKRRCNEDVSALSLDAVATTLRKQVPELMKQHKARSVEFKVVIKDGKAVLRALPKE